MKLPLYAISALYLLTAIYMFVAPQVFYDQTPGVAMMGPFNTHFIRDAGLAFLTSGGALHIWVWSARGCPGDQSALSNLVGIQLPAWLALFAAMKLPPNLQGLQK